MAVLSVATSRLRALQTADCKFFCIVPSSKQITNNGRFAFVEYEDRRDADDAYHEMHNKRFGRDDILKIEVRLPMLIKRDIHANNDTVGPHSPVGFVALRPQRP